MTLHKNPFCPICEEESLLPFSISLMETQKQYGTWVCTNCSFAISTQDTRGYNPQYDIRVDFIERLPKEIAELKKKFKIKSNLTI